MRKTAGKELVEDPADEAAAKQMALFEVESLLINFVLCVE